MKIVLSGIGVANKGAELMLYAVLQEIERRHPEATIYISTYALDPYRLNYVQTSLHLKYVPLHKFIRICNRLRFRLLKICLSNIPVPNADYFLDVSGFLFSDQFNLKDENVEEWRNKLSSYANQGTRICFLPQAFGPTERRNTLRTLALLSKYANVVIAREKVSYTYLQNMGFPSGKLYRFTDFTSLVNPVIPHEYSHLKDGICIIPNERMVSMNVLTIENYLKLLKAISEIAKEKGRKVYFLDHGGDADRHLAQQCVAMLGDDIDIVSNLNALEVKGLISTAYLCISSRFHGVASSLNCCVPCLATSWSHKYQELFNDYGLSDSVLPVMNPEATILKVKEYLSTDKNRFIRKQLQDIHVAIQQQAKDMWNIVWK